MLGLHYYSYQYYSYKDLQKLKEILKYDSIGEIVFDEDEKIIEYKINRSNCFLLSDLIELIKIGFIRFHLGQLLLLFINLLEKVIYMQNHNIKHNYLSLDSIWLKFENNQYLSILYKTVQYQIAFTGYQNKIQEDLSEPQCADSEKIRQIISHIIKYFINNDIVCNKESKSKKEIFNNIYQVILNSCQKQNIENTIYVIKQLLQNNQFDPDFQTISFDDKIIDHFKYSKRKFQSEKIQKQLQSLIQKYDQNPLVLDQFLFEKIYEMRINLKNWICSDLDETQEQNKYNKLLSNYQYSKDLLNREACIVLNHMINEQAKRKFEEFFKFEMDQSYKQQIIDLVMELKIFKYFENSKKIFKDINEDYYLKVLIDHAIPLVNECVDDYTQLQILTLMNDLI